MAKRIIPAIILLALLVGCGKTITDNHNQEIVNATNLTNTTSAKVMRDYPLKIIIPTGKASDIIIIKSGDKTAIIDSGEAESIKEVLPILSRLNSTTSEFHIITNSKFYRTSGEKYMVIRTMPGKVYHNGLVDSTEVGEAPSEAIKQDTEIMLGNAKLNVFVPYDSGRGYSFVSEENSLVIRLDYGTTRFLFTSDCETECLKSLNRSLRTDILMVPKHGCLNSLSLDMLSKIKPTTAIITKREEGCPSAEVTQMLELSGITTIVGDREITLYSDGTTVFVE